MRISLPVSIPRFVCTLMMGLALLTVGACFEPPDPQPTPPTTAPAPDPLTTEPTPDPLTTEPTPDPLTTEPTPDPPTTEPTADPPEPQPQGFVPESVVGVWCGGRNEAPGGHWTYAFAGDGTFAAENQEGGFSGYVDTQGDVMTFYVEGVSDPVESTWLVSYEEALGYNLLFLDGFSYVPGSCNS